MRADIPNPRAFAAQNIFVDFKNGTIAAEPGLGIIACTLVQQTRAMQITNKATLLILTMVRVRV